MASQSEEIDNMITDALREEGQRIINECVEGRGYTHRTKNLYDSYGYGVYSGGRLKHSGYLSASPEAKVGKKWYGEVMHGREEIQKYLSSYDPGTRGYALLIAAAMPYGKVLENRKYQVISMAYDELAAIAEGIPGATVTPLNGGNI